MILKEYLHKKYESRNPPITYDDKSMVRKDHGQINEEIRTEYGHLCRRLYMLFNVFPNFAHPHPTPKKKPVKYNKDGFQRGIVKKWTREALAPHEKIGTEYITDIYKIVSIFWCVVSWRIEDTKANKKQIIKGYKIIAKSSRVHGYSNKKERRKSYEYFFSCFPNKLEDIYRFFCQENSYNAIPYDILQLPPNILVIIKKDKFLSECFRNTEKTISLLNGKIRGEFDKNTEQIIDGYTETEGEAYHCAVSDSEIALFDSLAALIDGRGVIDAINWHNDWTVIDSANRKKLKGCILEIIKNDDLSTINRYVGAKSFEELRNKLSIIEDKLDNPDLYVVKEMTYNKKQMNNDCLGSHTKYDDFIGSYLSNKTK